MAKLKYSVFSHMILQKSFLYADLLFKKRFLSLSIFRMNCCLEKLKKNSVFLKKIDYFILFNRINTLTSDLCSVSLLNKSIKCL